ncbi:TonB-dependent receptor domain-containing protein [Pacificimonas sp. ICDLI1SI03]
MRNVISQMGRRVSSGSSMVAMSIALLASTATFAQALPAEPNDDDGVASEASTNRTIIVTGSRIQRDGFDLPTPTVVLGGDVLQQGARPNIQQVLNDQPQFRQTVTPQVSGGNTSSGTAPVDLRGLGTARTLTLLNGRRFVGDNNLNYIPTNLISRVDVVTGGASAAWGSDAVAGVVNIILNEDLEGVSLGANAGLASRGDAFRYGFDGSFGTSFADGRGHFLIGAEYLKDEGISDRNSRPNLGSTGIVPTADGTGVELVEDVNTPNTSLGGVITSGALAGQTFNPDGSLRPFDGPNARGIGGRDGISLYDTIYASTPFERISSYARLSYDVGSATVWVDGTYGRAESAYPFIPDITIPPLTIDADNPFLSQGIRNQLAAAGEDQFTFSRYFAGPYSLMFDSVRENMEAAIGIDGEFGRGFQYSAYFSHGEVDTDQELANTRLAGNFANAINAVSSGGQIVCAINADANPGNDDPACVPINPFGVGNISQEGIDYTTGTQGTTGTTKLDSMGIQVQGDILDLWAGPLTMAVGFESRWNEVTGALSAEAQAGGFGLPVYNTPVEGQIDVQEGFVEAALPLLDVVDTVALDFNGAARYSDYSQSGGIWSWKLGGTARLFNDILLRVTRSRDIRAPSTGELFGNRSLNLGSVADDRSIPGANLGPGYEENPTQVETYTGGNIDLVPEVSNTLTFGTSITPSFLPGFNLSVDYYDIDIGNAIFALGRDNTVISCAAGNQVACDNIERDGNGTITTIFANQQNIATFQTSGIDFEASYVRPLGNGNVRVRGVATYIDKFVFEDGVARVDSAGLVGAGGSFAIPEWRANVSLGYDDDNVGGDVRVRYVDGGVHRFEAASATPLVNNSVDSRTYVDLGLRFKVSDEFRVAFNVNNVFDVNAPLSTVAPALYDIYGTYYTVSTKVNF